MAFVMKNSSGTAANTGVQNIRFQNLSSGGETRIDTELKVSGGHTGQTSWTGDYEAPGNYQDRYCRIRFTVNYATPGGASNCFTSVEIQKNGFICSAVGRVENNGCLFNAYLNK
jgi:hypothetical protein